MPEVSRDLLKYFKGFCLTPSVILLFVYMKCRFSLSYRELEEMMSIRGSATVQCWSKGFTQLIHKRVRASNEKNSFYKNTNHLI